MKLEPAVFEKEDGFKRLADLIRVLVDQKIDQVQFNVVFADTLKAAQTKPESYIDRVVKVAVYNARIYLADKDRGLIVLEYRQQRVSAIAGTGSAPRFRAGSDTTEMYYRFGPSFGYSVNLLPATNGTHPL